MSRKLPKRTGPDAAAASVRGVLRFTCVALAGLLVAMLAGAPRAAAASDRASLVNPLVGTAIGAPAIGQAAGAGNTVPGAATPFGMVQWSPDTLPTAAQRTGGYAYEDDRLKGFSLTHISGVGCPVYGDAPFLPVPRAVTRVPDVERDAPRFSHRHEHAEPGSYALITRDGVRTDLTATARSGAGRFTFPARRRASVLVNAGGSAAADDAARLRVDPARREISGIVASGAFCASHNTYRLHWVARFSRPFASSGTWRGDRLSPGGRTARAAPAPARAGAYASWDTRRTRTVEVRVGVSFTDLAGARRNLTESAGKPLARVRRSARRAWNAALSSARVAGGRRADRQTFTTALYHSLLHPNVFSDVDGRYAGMDGKVHRLARGRVQYANVSGWDIYRTEIPLLAMIAPRRAAGIADSLVRDARESGCLPRWPVANGQTSVMVGDPSAPIITSASALGARDFDRRAALRALVRGGTRTCRTREGYVEREELAAYLRLGWVPHERSGDGFAHVYTPSLPWGSVSTTLEYALADFGIGRLAASLGDRANATRFARRGRNWRHVIDPATERATPRFGNGDFLSGVVPASSDGFAEGTAEQYTWFVPQDPAGLIGRVGGKVAARKRLDSFFSAINAGPGSSQAYLGNEPTLSTPWLYHWVGRPDRTESVVRRALLGLYSPTPAGLPGNDDAGTMSAWWVLAALGLYPPVPGDDLMLVGAPLFPRAALRTAHGTVRISAPGATRGRPYVRTLSVNGRASTRSWLRWAALRGGATVRVGVAATPSSAWGRGAPPSPGR